MMVWYSRNCWNGNHKRESDRWRESGASMVSVESAGAAAQVMHGHCLLVVCAVLYLFWWAVFFRPDAHVERVLRGCAIAAILLAAVCGIVGLILVGGALPRLGGGGAAVGGDSGVNGLLPDGGRGLTGVPLWVFAVGGIIAYVALAAVTQGLLHRQITTELVLIVLWAAFELAAICRLGGAGVIPMAIAMTLLALTVVLFVGSMVCYVLYYRLPAWPAFLTGCAPLVAVGIEAAAIAVFITV